MYLLDLESLVLSEPKIAFTPNFRYGVTLFPLLASVGDVAEDSSVDSTPRTNAGIVDTPSPGMPTAAVGTVVSGLEISAD